MSALGDVIVDALKELLRILFKPISNVIERHATELIETIVSTPHPNEIFNRPTNGGWSTIYDYYWDTLIPLTLFIWALVIGLVIFLETTSHLFSSYHHAKLKRRAFTGLLGILSWWWMAAIALRFTNSLTGYLVPDLSDISLFETLSFTTMGVLGLVISLSIDLVLFMLIALIYFARQVILYLFVLLMPLLIVFWIPGIGPFARMAGFMKQLAGFFVPFLFMTVPVALLFRLGELLGSNFGLSMSGIGAWLIALIIPLVAVLAPIVLLWQAGTLMSLGEQVAAHSSTRRAEHRITKAQKHRDTATLARGNFARGVQNTPPVNRDGQYLLGSGGSRAHAAGSRLSASGAALKQRLSTTKTRLNDLKPRTENPPDGDVSNVSSRNHDFEHLRKRNHPKPARDRTRVSGDDRPWYIN